MGAINYRAGKYITIGYDAQKIKDIMAEEYGLEDEDEVEEVYNNTEREDYDSSMQMLENSGVLENDFFEVKLEYGYYEGFYLDISDLQYCYFDDLEEKEDALKQAEKIRELLVKMVENGLCQCFPGWCTGWEENEEKIKENIENAYKMMVNDIEKLEIMEDN